MSTSETQDLITCVCGGTYSPQRYDVCPQCSMPLATLRERNAGAANAPVPGHRGKKSRQDRMFGAIRVVVTLAFVAGLVAYSINYESNLDTGGVIKASCEDIVSGRYKEFTSDRQKEFFSAAKADAITASQVDSAFSLISRSIGDLADALAAGDQARADQVEQQVLVDCAAIGVGTTIAQ